MPKRFRKIAKKSRKTMKKSFTRRIRRPRRPRYASRRMNTRMKRATRKKRGIVVKKISVERPLFGSFVTQLEDNTQFFAWHNDAALVFNKSFYYPMNSEKTGFDKLMSPLCYQTRRGNSIVIPQYEHLLKYGILDKVTQYPMGTTSESIINDLTKLFNEYHEWHPGGLKISYRPHSSVVGKAYVMNYNNKFMVDPPNFTDLNFYPEALLKKLKVDPLIPPPKREEGPDVGLDHAHCLTIGTNLQKCSVYNPNKPFTHFFKRRVPHTLVEDGKWLKTRPQPDDGQDSAKLILSTWPGCGVIYMNIEDRFYHAADFEARNNMANVRMNQPLGFVKFTYYIHFRKKDRQFTSLTRSVFDPYENLVLADDVVNPTEDVITPALPYAGNGDIKIEPENLFQ